jgi:hypothetical protein
MNPIMERGGTTYARLARGTRQRDPTRELAVQARVQGKASSIEEHSHMRMAVEVELESPRYRCAPGIIGHRPAE